MTFKTVIADYQKEDGTHNLEVYIYHDGQRATLKTDYFVKAEHFGKGKVIKHPNADYLNAKIDEIKNKLQRHALNNEGITPKELKRWSGKVTASLFEYLDQFIKGITDQSILINKGKSKGMPYKKNTIDNIVTCRSHLQAFNPNLKWQDINEDFYDSFIAYFRGKGCADNTVAKNMNVVAAIMDRSKKIHDSTAYQQFHMPYKESDAIFLNEIEIEQIMKAKLPRHLQPERLRFYLSYNFFLRFGDSITLNKEDIFTQGDSTFVKLMDEKTNNTRIIPLLPYTVELLNKCNYKLPKSTNQESNRDLKEIGRLAGIDSIYTQITTKAGIVSKMPAKKYNFITTHTARRSITTNLYLSMVKHKNVDLKKLQLMGGWKSVAMLEKYLKIDKLVNAMSAAGDPFFN